MWQIRIDTATHNYVELRQELAACISFLNKIRSESDSAIIKVTILKQKCPACNHPLF